MTSKKASEFAQNKDIDEDKTKYSIRKMNQKPENK
jgi:hypothetical protein